MHARVACALGARPCAALWNHMILGDARIECLSQNAVMVLSRRQSTSTNCKPLSL